MFFVNWDSESEKAKALVLKADSTAPGAVDGELYGPDIAALRGDTRGQSFRVRDCESLEPFQRTFETIRQRADSSAEAEPLEAVTHPICGMTAVQQQRVPSAPTSRGSSPEGRPIVRLARGASGSVGSHHSFGQHHVGSVSGTLTGSFIASLTNHDLASGSFRRV